MAFCQIQKMAMGIGQWWLKKKRKGEKEASKTARNWAPLFIHAKHLEFDFFCRKMSKTFVFIPVSTSITGKQGRQRVFKILKKTLSIPNFAWKMSMYKKIQIWIHMLLQVSYMMMYGFVQFSNMKNWWISPRPWSAYHDTCLNH